MKAKHGENWLLGAGLILAACGTSSAHHSAAMFDHQNLITLTGTVKQFEWTSPHVWIFLVATKDGKEDTWAIESNDPSTMSRRGWGKRTVATGDRITVSIAPRKDGMPSGLLYVITLPDGHQMSGGGAPGPNQFGNEQKSNP